MLDHSGISINWLKSNALRFLGLIAFSRWKKVSDWAEILCKSFFCWLEPNMGDVGIQLFESWETRTADLLKNSIPGPETNNFCFLLFYLDSLSISYYCHFFLSYQIRAASLFSSYLAKFFHYFVFDNNKPHA